MIPKRSSWYAEIAVAILILVLIVLCIFLVRQYRIIARQKVISTERIQFAYLLRHHSIGAADTDLIEPWMTFDYVSFSFKVPTSYLVTALGISSSTTGYPNVTLGHYARMIATSSDALTKDVRGVVQNYLAPVGK